MTLTDPTQIVEALRPEGTRLTGLPVGGARVSELVAARIERGGQRLHDVDQDASRHVLFSSDVVLLPTRGERTVFVHRDPVPGAAPAAGAGQAGEAPTVGTFAVGFDSTGRLVNGQHRLSAVVRAETPARFLVATGLDPSVFAVLDGGKVRNGADVLHIRGFANAACTSALVRFVALAEQGNLWTRNRGGRMELDALVARAEQDRERFVASAREGYRLYEAGKETGGVLTPSHTALAVYAFDLAGAGVEIRGYLGRVATGISVAAADDPAHPVRQAFLDDQRADVAMGRHERLAILLRGAQHAALGEPMKRARGKGAGAWPSPQVPAVDGRPAWPQQTSPAKARAKASAIVPIADPAVLDADELEGDDA